MSKYHSWVTLFHILSEDYNEDVKAAYVHCYGPLKDKVFEEGSLLPDGPATKKAHCCILELNENGTLHVKLFVGHNSNLMPNLFLCLFPPREYYHYYCYFKNNNNNDNINIINCLHTFFIKSSILILGKNNTNKYHHFTEILCLR